MSTGTKMDPEIPLPLGAVEPGTAAQPGGDAAAGTVPLPLDVGGFESAVAQPGGDAAAGTVPLPLDVGGFESAVAQPGGDAAAGTVPLPLDVGGFESAAGAEKSSLGPAPKRSKSRQATDRSRSKGS